MSVGTKLLQAAAGNAGEAVYVDDLFSTFLYEGTGASLNIVNGLDLSGEGGLIWTKTRTSATDHALMDTERGVAGTGGFLESNTTNAAETGFGSDYGPTAYNNNGYTLGSSGSPFNADGVSYCSWTFRKAEKFFDVVTYTGDGTTGRQIAHNLGSSPGMMFFKKTNGTGDWKVFHRSLSGSGLNGRLRLDSYGAEISLTNNFFVSSTYFGSDYYNASGDEWVVYLFAHDEQDFGENSDEAIIKCGSYEGNGSTTGPVVDLGFEPQWLLIKNIDDGQDGMHWYIFDNMRGIANGGENVRLKANKNDADAGAGSSSIFDVSATGFQLNTTSGSYNASGDTFIYMAIARPHKPASEFVATDMFTQQSLTAGEGADTFISTGFDVDAVLYRKGTASSPIIVGDRLRGGQKSGGDLKTSDTDAEASNSGAFFLDESRGVTVDFAGGHFNASPAATDQSYIRYFLRRVSGFFDVVAYTGTLANRTISHNLNAVPELIIIKARASTEGWIVGGYKDAQTFVRLDLGNAEFTNTTYFQNTLPTSTEISLGAHNNVNGSAKTYIAYLFATVSGISKVGSYTGTGSDLNVDCGFSAGARFVFAKRTDSTGDWYLWDSARGIVAGNDPYFLLNDQSAGQVSNTDYIDPLNAGFTITSSAPAALNNSGGTYIFLAIA